MPHGQKRLVAFPISVPLAPTPATRIVPSTPDSTHQHPKSVSVKHQRSSQAHQSASLRPFITRNRHHPFRPIVLDRCPHPRGVVYASHARRSTPPKPVGYWWTHAMFLQYLPYQFLSPMQYRPPCINPPCSPAIPSVASMGFQLVVLSPVGAFLSPLTRHE